MTCRSEQAAENAPRRRSQSLKPLTVQHKYASGFSLFAALLEAILSSLMILLMASLAFAGHAGELDTPGVMPHELVAGLVGLAAILLLAVLALAWVIWRLRGLERRLRELEENRRD
jgi:hypothetical protein